MNDTPRANRLHIGLFGKRNAGKSSLINCLTRSGSQPRVDIPGTTTDPVFKAMEIHGLGPCVFIDTAGFDDEGELGELRIRQTQRALEKTDIALMSVPRTSGRRVALATLAERKECACYLDTEQM